MRLSQLHPNEGQINGVPNNPRKITEEELSKLKKSIKNAPEFLSARPIIVNEAFEILGGNMRYRALCALRDEKVFDDVIPDEWVRVVKWTRKKQREFVLRDNQSNGKDDLELLAKWDTNELAEWGANVPIFDDEEQKPYEGEEQKT